MMKLQLALCVFACVVLGLVDAQCASPYRWPVPNRWPAEHTHREVMYSAKLYQKKMVYYSYPTRQLRYDATYLGGKISLGSVLNMTSMWLNDTLYIYTFETGAGRALPPNCIALQMGFGMMRPDWFQDGNQSGLVWQAKKSDFFDEDYHRVLMTVKDAGQGGPADDEVFTYYSWYENNTQPGSENGAPFLMHAPSPPGMVVNEYYDFTEHTFAADSEVFKYPLPGAPRCIPAGFAATHHEAFAIMQKHGVSTAHHVEVTLGYLTNKQRA